MADAFATLPGPRYFEPAIETMPRSALRALQEEKLAALVPYVVERSPLHARLWQAAGVTPQDVRSLDDFTRLAPSFDVHALRAAGDPFGGLLCVDRDDPGVQGIRVNGGSNGPVADCYTTSATVCRDWWEMGVRRGDYVAYVQVTSHGDGMLDTLRRLGATVVPFDHHADDLARLAARSRALRPAMLYALSEPIWNAIPPLCAHLGLDPIGVFGSYRSIVYAGDGLTPPVRALAASWGVELFDQVSLGDVGTAFECRAHDGMHVWEDGTLVEVVDPMTGLPVTDGGRGEMVVTSLDDRVTPRLRFRTGDLIEMVPTPCACGRTHARVRRLGHLPHGTAR